MTRLDDTPGAYAVDAVPGAAVVPQPLAAKVTSVPRIIVGTCSIDVIFVPPPEKDTNPAPPAIFYRKLCS
jgi:hypothetical protein